jgi:transposase
MRQLLDRLRDHWKYLDDSINEYTHELEAIAKRHDACRRLVTVPGIGPLGATALVAAVGNGAAFKRGRELAAWLGLVPRQQSTGGKATLLGITKRGNPYVRKLLIHGARSLVKHLHRENHELGLWITQLELRAHKNVVAVAVANKLARIAWAVLARGDLYRSESTAAA